MYAQAAKVRHVTLEVTRSTDPQAAEDFHAVKAFISYTEAFLDGSYQGRRRT